MNQVQQILMNNSLIIICTVSESGSKMIQQFWSDVIQKEAEEIKWTERKNAKPCSRWSLQRPSLPLTVRQANEVWLPTWKDTGPESFSLTLLRVRECLLPSTWITFISLLWRGTPWSSQITFWAPSWDTKHSKDTSSPSVTMQLFSSVSIVMSSSVQYTSSRIHFKPVLWMWLTNALSQLCSWNKGGHFLN